MYNELAIIFGNNLKTLRKALDLTQEELAGRIGVGRRAYINYEKGNSLPSMDIFCKICDSLDVKASDILNEKFVVERKIIITSSIKD